MYDLPSITFNTFEGRLIMDILPSAFPTFMGGTARYWVPEFLPGTRYKLMLMKANAVFRLGLGQNFPPSILINEVPRPDYLRVAIIDCMCMESPLVVPCSESGWQLEQQCRVANLWLTQAEYVLE